MTGGRYTPVIEFQGGREWAGVPVPSEAAARSALEGMLAKAGAPVLAARIDVTGSIRVPLRELGPA